MSETTTPARGRDLVRTKRIGTWFNLLSRLKAVDTDAAAEDLVAELTRAERAITVSFLNFHALNLAFQNPIFMSDLLEANVLLRDGVGVEVCLKMLGLKAGRNMNGTDLIPRILRRSEGKTIAVFGTTEPWLSRAVSRIVAEGGRVVCMLDGFQPQHAYVALVQKFDPDIVLLGMGMEVQERVSSVLAHECGRPRLFLNGGAVLDFYAERFARAPGFFQKLRAEWLFRLAQEPRRLSQRYLLGGTAFIYRIVALAVSVRLEQMRSGAMRINPRSLAAGAVRDQTKGRLPGVVIASPGGRAGRGGMASVTRSMAEWLEGKGGSVDILDTRGGGASWKWPFFFIGAAARLLVLWIIRRPTVLHLQVSERNSFIRKGLLLLLGHALGMTVILHHHGAELIPFYRTTAPPMRRWTRWIIRRAHHNLVLGERWLAFLRDEVGADSGRLEVLYNASADLSGPVQLARKTRRETGPVSETVHVVLMANLSPRKGIGEFLQALQSLRSAGMDIRATLAGGGDIERYVKEAEALGMSDRCRFAGWVDRAGVPDLFAAADVLVLPSHEEGLPMAILEALSCHVPVVATPVGSIGELLLDGRDCLLVTPGDSGALADAIRRIALDPELSRRLAENGRILFDRTFELERYMQRLVGIYTHAASRNRPDGRSPA